MSKDNDKVGYGRPPNATQFQPGKSGNPKGRPKGTKNLKSDLAEELAERVLVTECGQQRNISKQRAMLKSLMAKAVQGDGRAADTVIKLVERLLTDRNENQGEDDLSNDDQLILERFLARKQGGGSVDV